MKKWYDEEYRFSIEGSNVKDYVCPDGCVCFRMTAEKTGSENFYTGKYYQEQE